MITLTAFRIGAVLRAGPGARPPRALGTRGGGYPLPGRLMGPEDTDDRRLSRIAAVWPGSCHRDGQIKLFESGPSCSYRRKSEALMPSDPDGRMRTTAWMFAALNTVEPPIQTLAGLDLFHAGEAWASARRPDAVAAVQKRLAALEDWLGGRDYLEDRFTAGDLLMTTVLRILRHTDIVSERPALKTYRSAARRGPPSGRRWRIT